MTDPWIEETQKTLGTLITKPKLGEKYLKKPPFRFLHDALTETIRATGFGQGLYNETELDAGNIQDKQAKLDFLNKMISCVSFALGEKLDVSANKIVAGLEPEKTNAFLVKIYEAATTKLEASPDAVNRVMNGETVADKKEKKAKKDKADDEEPAADAGGAEEEERRKKEEEKKRKEEKKRRAEEKAKAEAEAAAAAEATAAASEEEERKRKKEEEREKRREEEKRKKEEERAAKKEEERAEKKKRQEEEKKRADEDARRMEEEQRAMQSQPIAAQHQMPDMDGFAAADGVEERKDMEIVPDEKRTRERPLTAGRKPPKITSKVKDQKEEPGMQAAPAPTAAMLISEGLDEADDDMFVTEEVQQQPPSEMLNAGGDQGKLVRELLEAKKEQAKESAPEETNPEANQSAQSGIRMGKLKRKKDDANLRYSEVDIDKLSLMTQQLCQTVNPLGKSVDLIYQDIASMSKELDQWRAEYRGATERQQVEREQTEKQLAPLHQKVAAIDDQIADMNSRIAGIRSRIQNNDGVIQQLLETIAYPGS